MNGLRSFRVFRLACIFFVVGRISGARVQARPKVLPFDEFRASYSTADEPDQSYTDHHLFVAAVETSHDKENLDRLEEETPALSFWGPSLVSSNVSILVPPEMAADFQKSLGKFKIAYTVASQNLQSWIDHERAENPPQNLFLIGSEPSRFSLNQYHSFEEISAYLDGIAAKYPDIVQANTIGTSYEGRPIKGEQNPNHAKLAIIVNPNNRSMHHKSHPIHPNILLPRSEDCFSPELKQAGCLDRFGHPRSRVDCARLLPLHH